MRADAQRNAARIVRVAIAGLEDSGRPLRLDELAERAGVGVATLYRLFGGRDGLVAEAFATFFREEVEPLAGGTHLGGTDLGGTDLGGTDVGGTDVGGADLGDVLRATVEVLAAHRVLLRAARDAGAVRIEVMSGYLGSLAALLDAAQQRGEVRADVTVRDLGGILVMALADVHDRDPTGADRRRAVALLLAGLRPGGPPLPPPAAPSPPPR